MATVLRNEILDFVPNVSMDFDFESEKPTLLTGLPPCKVEGYFQEVSSCYGKREICDAGMETPISRLKESEEE